MARPVGIREVAAKAGVAVGTVSNVLNKPERVTPSTVELVLATMDELGFVRNDLARQLKMGGGTTLGMIVHNFSNPFFGDLAHACEEAAESLGHTVILGSSDQLTGREDRYIDLFEEQRVRGMIVASVGGLTARMSRLIKRGMPLVLLDVGDDDGDFCTVALDGVAGAYVGIRHLIDTGRRRIVFLGGPPHQVGDRWQGATAAVAETPGVTLTRVDTRDQTIAAGREAGDRIAAMPADARPDAIFAANDLLALGVMQSLVLGDDIDVPRDIAIVGFDDIDYAASAIVPLTTIRQSPAALAEQAIRLVLGHAGDPGAHVHEHVRLTPELVIRQSSLAR
jgi:LacI family transcriptional regulator